MLIWNYEVDESVWIKVQFIGFWTITFHQRLLISSKLIFLLQLKTVKRETLVMETKTKKRYFGHEENNSPQIKACVFIW